MLIGEISVLFLSVKKTGTHNCSNYIYARISMIYRVRDADCEKFYKSFP